MKNENYRYNYGRREKHGERVGRRAGGERESEGEREREREVYTHKMIMREKRME